MKKIFFLFFLSLCSCTTTTTTTTSKLENSIRTQELRKDAREKQFMYLDCVNEASLKYAVSTDAASEVALAAIGKCESKLNEVRKAYFLQVNSIGKKNTVDLDIQLSEEAASKLKNRAYEAALSSIIEVRTKNK